MGKWMVKCLVKCMGKRMVKGTQTIGDRMAIAWLPTLVSRGRRPRPHLPIMWVTCGCAKPSVPKADRSQVQKLNPTPNK
jgi:hypothetical protein